MASLLKLYWNLQANQLVRSNLDGGQFVLPIRYQNDVVPIELRLVTPRVAGGYSNPFDIVTDQYSVQIGVVTPHPSSSTIHASITLTYALVSASDAKYTGSLALNTASITTLLGAALSVTSTWELEAAAGGDYYTLQVPVTIKADGFKTGSTSPVPTTSYPTFPEADASYVKREGAAGEGFTLLSPDGTKRTLVWLDNDGVMRFDVVS